MWILVAEAMLACGLLLFIVWWTLGPTQRRERETLRRMAEEASAGSKPAPSSGSAHRRDDPVE